MKLHRINLLIILCFFISISWSFTGECYCENNGEDKIDIFVREFKLQKLDDKEATASIKKKGLKEVKEKTSHSFISISAFDLSDDGEILVSAKTGTNVGVIAVYDINMNLQKSFSYKYKFDIDFVVYGKNRILLTGHKFHGVYVIDLSDGDITAYEWTDYDYIDKIYELGAANQEKEREGVFYYLSNSKNRKPTFYVSPPSYRYLIAKNGGEKKVLLDSGNTMIFLWICIILFVIGIATIAVRRWLKTIKRNSDKIKESNMGNRR